MVMCYFFLASFALLVPGLICLFAEIFGLLDLSDQKSGELCLGIFFSSSLCMYEYFLLLHCAGETFYLSTILGFIGLFAVH